MRIPYVIDNQTHKMADVLNQLLAGHEGKCLDIATAYFNVQGFRLLQAGLVKLNRQSCLTRLTLIMIDNTECLTPGPLQVESGVVPLEVRKREGEL